MARVLRGAHPGLPRRAGRDFDGRATSAGTCPVWELGGQGVFVKEVQAAVLDGRADMAVHSAKDLPSSTPEGLVLAAVTARADPRDALVGSRLDDLAPGARVATGSVRRRAQLAWIRPDLTFTGLRGNIATRLDRVPEGGALVVASAALERLGLAGRAAEILPVAVMLPQVGQGAIGVECRAGDDDARAALEAVDDPDTRTEVTAERAYLARLGRRMRSARRGLRRSRLERHDPDRGPAGFRRRPGAVALGPIRAGGEPRCHRGRPRR